MNRLLVLACGLSLSACGDDGGGGGATTATATFAGLNGQTVTGTATFTKSGSSVSLSATFTAAPDGTHGLHLHANPACGNEGMDAGGHWDIENSGSAGHGLPPGGHIGDMGNVTISGGAGSFVFSNPEWTLGDGSATDIVPHAIIFHQLMDDGSMPSAGARWGCAVIMAD